MSELEIHTSNEVITDPDYCELLEQLQVSISDAHLLAMSIEELDTNEILVDDEAFRVNYSTIYWIREHAKAVLDLIATHESRINTEC